MNLGGTIQTMTDSQDRKNKIRHAVLEGAYANEGLWSLNFINLAACLPAVQETRFDPWVGKILWRRKWQPTPVLLPGKSHGQRNVVVYSLWGCKELDTTERLHLGIPGGSEAIASACNEGDLGLIPESGRSPGEGHGNQLHYSCLENPMDRGALWAIVHGVTKSQTWLND